MALDLRALAFIAAIILLARPITVYLSLLGTKFHEVSAHYGIHRSAGGGVGRCGGIVWRTLLSGIADGAMMAPLAFGLVAVTVVLHGFRTPVARALGSRAGMHPVF